MVVQDEGLLARFLQHETEHLDRLLYVDRLTGPRGGAAREAVKDRGWERYGLTKWTPVATKAKDV